MLSKRTLLETAACGALLAALSACGGSGSDDVASASPGTGAGSSTGSPQQSAAGDSFVAHVLSFLSATSETNEPQAIDAITTTAPDASDPQPVS